MTFTDFLKTKKDIDPEGSEMGELMELYYEEYTEFMMTLKEGCSTE